MPGGFRVVERLVQQAAVEMGIDPVALRRRNYIPPDAFPYKTPTGSVYENADFAGLTDKALTAADWSGYAVRHAASAKAGKLRGRGIATVIETTNAGMYNQDQIALDVNREGRVTVHAVSHSQGQGHETTLAMLVARALEIPRSVSQCARSRYCCVIPAEVISLPQRAVSDLW